MELRQLRYALAVAEHLGFERAARSIGITQSAISRSIDSLEQELGVVLFERHSGGARTTAVGRAVLERAQQPFRQISDLRAYALASGLADQGCLTVGFFQDLSGGLLRTILTRHRLDRPEVRTLFLETAAADQLKALREGRIDIAFLVSVDGAPGAESDELWREHVYLAVPKEHPLAERQTVEWVDLRDERFLVRAFDSGPFVYLWVADCLGFQGYAPMIEQLNVSRASLFNLVASGYGVAPCTEAAIEATYPGVKFIPIVGEKSTVPVRAAWLSDNFNPVLQRFLSDARQIVRAAGDQALAGA